MSRLFFSRNAARWAAALIVAGAAATGAYRLLHAGAAPQLREPVRQVSVPDDPTLIARGGYLARLGDCAGCHTATKDAPFAGGRGIGSPFGIIYSTNITPDPQTGIGRYSYADFERALRDGVRPDGTHLYPAMPYPSFAKITDQDIHALYAYFMRGVDAISNQAPRTSLAFPFNQRWGLWFWNIAFAPRERFEPVAERGRIWNRGAYIVQSLGHCGACHTPRGPAFEERGFDETSSRYLTGGVNDHWFAPNLTGDPGSGLGRLSERDIVSFLKTGHASAHHGAAFGSMVEVVEDSTQYFNEEDLRAVAHYLKSLPAHEASGAYQPQSTPAQQPAGSPQAGASSMAGHIGRPGAGLYNAFCAKCHHADGGGEPPKFPALAGNPAVLAPNPTSLIRLLLQGGRSPQSMDGPRAHKMPAFQNQLTDTEMARVLTFVRGTWGNQASAVTTRQVSVLRDKLAQ